MSEAQELADILKQRGAGKTAGIIACILAVLGILFLGFVFVPLATLVALFGTITAVKNKNTTGIGINVLAWILIIVGLITSPVLLTMIGIGSSL
jgi:hypothetical protein